MTEFGVDAYNNITQSEDQDMQVSGSTLLFNELAMYSKQNKITGGFFFQYADVWWKFGSPLVQDHHGWKAGGFPDKVANEEWWGVFTLSPGSPNVLTPRKMFTALADLHKNTHPYGYIASYLDGSADTPNPSVQVNGTSTSSSKTGYIAGGVIVGGVVLIAAVVLLRKKLNSAKESDVKSEETLEKNEKDIAESKVEA
jgi:hypothetical protein